MPIRMYLNLLAGILAGLGVSSLLFQAWPGLPNWAAAPVVVIVTLATGATLFAWQEERRDQAGRDELRQLVHDVDSDPEAWQRLTGGK